MNEKNFNSLFQLSEIENNEDKYKVRVNINAEHHVFEGHFPEKAILPGVVMAELIKQISGKIVGAPLTMKKARNLKFLGLVDPAEVNYLDVELTVTDGDLVKVKAEATHGEKTYLKESVEYAK